MCACMSACMCVRARVRVCVPDTQGAGGVLDT